MINVAVLGYGTIGSGVARIIEENNELLKHKISDDIDIKYILDLRDFPNDKNEHKVVHDIDIIINDPDVDIVVEAMGGVEPAHTFVKAALEAGKSVTTSNKALVAEKGAALLKLAREKNVNFFFGASVGGGIPIIRPLQSCITADVIERISGILNGTTNFMMSAMYENGADYDQVLKEAQQLGYAEADPTADVEGYDACRKIAILTSIVAERQIDFNDIHTEGISKISAEDIKYAKAMNRRIKLIADSIKVGDTFSIIVSPVLIEEKDPLYGVNDVFNAITVRGNMLGDAMFYGSGAGSLPTASAVVADVVQLSKNIGNNIPTPWDENKLTLSDYKKLKHRFFIRIGEYDKDAALRAFDGAQVYNCDIKGEIGILTQLMSEEEFDKKLQGINIIKMIRARA